MERHSVGVAGIVLTFSKVWRRITIQGVFRLKRPDGTIYTAIEDSMDKQATMPFSMILNTFDRLYEQSVKKVWVSETGQVRSRYFQFDKLTSPDYACLPGHWLLYAEL